MRHILIGVGFYLMAWLTDAVSFDSVPSEFGQCFTFSLVLVYLMAWLTDAVSFDSLVRSVPGIFTLSLFLIGV